MIFVMVIRIRWSNLPTREEDDPRNSGRNGSGKCQNSCLRNLNVDLSQLEPVCHFEMFAFNP